MDQISMNAASMPNFLEDFRAFVRACQDADYTDNHDYRRFGPKEKGRLRLLAERAAGATLRLDARKALNTIRSIVDPSWAAFAFVDPNLHEWQWLYTALDDSESRELLVKILAYRALGNRKVKLPLNTPEYWSRLRAIECMTEPNAESREADGWNLDLFDLNNIGYPVRLYATPTSVFAQFLNQQYQCNSGSREISAAPGDVVIDGGACWGDSALNFANKVGPEGKVLSFEFLPSNLAVFECNMRLNQELSDRIELIKNPLWSVAEKELHVNPNGPGTQVSERQSNERTKVRTATIDGISAAKNLQSVDFIKMDIEGAELQALLGAEKTIRKFRPKLAICLYHRLSDFWTIPRYIQNLGCGYRFHIRHFTIHAEETILFADPC